MGCRSGHQRPARHSACRIRPTRQHVGTAAPSTSLRAGPCCLAERSSAAARSFPSRAGLIYTGAVLGKFASVPTYLFFLVLGAIVPAAAQTAVEGFVRDVSGNAVPGASITLRRSEGPVLRSTITDASGKFHFAAVDAGTYKLKTEAPGFYPSSYEFVLRSRQPVALTLELQKRETIRENVEVRAGYLTVDPEKTGSSYTFTHQDLESLPEPLVDSTNNLVTNLMPGTSDSHDNFLAVRGTEFSLHEFTNGVSFLDNTQPQFSSGASPQIFETVDLMTVGFIPHDRQPLVDVLVITTP